jgi:dTDP-glucose 4,6-dehydratase
MIFVTGGAGFIGSNFVLDWLAQSDEPVLNYDKLTYAGNLNNLASLKNDARHTLCAAISATRPRCWRCSSSINRAPWCTSRPKAVDRSILGPGEFINTNINGTFSLLEAARAYWSALPDDEKAAFRFLHVSTDEVYGTLGPDDAPFSETTAFAPNSPYSASKAASDHWCVPTSTPTACRC